jgi:transcription antitermination protein NusB
VSARRKARKRALDFLYEADLRSANLLDLYHSRPSEDLSQEGYVLTLLQGVTEHSAKIDELIVTYAQGWDMDRMPAIDRNLLRLSIYEILWESGLDDKIAVNEAVEMAAEISTTESSAYINGVLGRIIAIKASILD